jgi:hypothetical protein
MVYVACTSLRDGVNLSGGKAECVLLVHAQIVKSHFRAYLWLRGKSTHVSRYKSGREKFELETACCKSFAIRLFGGLPFHKDDLGRSARSNALGEAHDQASPSFFFSKHQETASRE